MSNTQYGLGAKVFVINTPNGSLPSRKDVLVGSVKVRQDILKRSVFGAPKVYQLELTKSKKSILRHQSDVYPTREEALQVVRSIIKSHLDLHLAQAKASSALAKELAKKLRAVK
jgi:hypothetical protein